MDKKITLSLVIQALSELKKAGKPHNLRAIQKYLGGIGSLNTISSYLKQYESQQKSDLTAILAVTP